MNILDELAPEYREAISREAIRRGRDAKSLLIDAATEFAKKLAPEAVPPWRPSPADESEKIKAGSSQSHHDLPNPEDKVVAA